MINSSAPDSPLLPPLYAGWIGDLLRAPIPDETESTCIDCAMCKSKDVVRTRDDHVFHSKTKCCTYVPKIPNYLVGRILLDQDPSFSAGRLRFLGQFFVFSVVTPLGVMPAPAENARYGVFQQDFGQNPDLRCPYFIEEGGLCGIWKYRNATCSTWFCKHVRGQVGLHFWRALKDLLKQVEEKLTVWCLHELNAGDEEFRRLFPLEDTDLELFQKQQAFYYAISKTGNSSFQRQAWGKWFGAERSFYEECSRLMEGLKWERIAEMGGTEMKRATGLLTQCFEQLIGLSIPRNLKAVRCKSFHIDSETVRVWGYSRYDPIDLPVSIFEALEFFDGRPADVVLERIRTERNLPLSREWLRKLCDFGILSSA